MLAARDVHAALGGAPVLRGVSLDVRAGEVLALIGPNGAGKSTLIGVLSGAIAPRRGRVCLDSRPLAKWPRRALARRRAVLPQAATLSFPFRALDVAMLGRGPHLDCCGRAGNAAAARAALAETGALHLAERLWTTLSGGERQRVRLALALAQVWPEANGSCGGAGARYILFDEPTNNLDLAWQQAFARSARRLAAGGHGVLAALHDPNMAALHADRICVLSGGRIVADGPPESVISPGLFEAAFGVRVRTMPGPDPRRPIVLPA